jgi:hypothetical protein
VVRGDSYHVRTDSQEEQGFEADEARAEASQLREDQGNREAGFGLLKESS